METDCRFSASDSLEKLRIEELKGKPETMWTIARKVFLSALTYTDKENKPIIQRLEALEAALAEVKTRGIRYCGVFQRALDYKLGDVCTHSGSAWVFVGEGKGVPGDDSSWQLMVKGGH